MTCPGWSRPDSEPPQGKGKGKGKPKKKDLAAEAFEEGLRLVRANRALAAIGFSTCRRDDCPHTPDSGLVRVDSNGVLHVHPTRRAEPAEWAWAIAHCIIHLGFGHVPAAPKLRDQPDGPALAADCAVVNRFLLGFPIGVTPEDLPASYPGGDEEQLAARWRRDGVPPSTSAAVRRAASRTSCSYRGTPGRAARPPTGSSTSRTPSPARWPWRWTWRAAGVPRCAADPPDSSPGNGR